MSVLIDSDIVIEVLRGRDQAILAQWSVLAASTSPILVSPITFAEIGAGALAGETPMIARFFAPLTCVAIDEKIGHLAGEYLRRYSKSHNLKIADALIAASAVQNQAALWTRNRKHYPMADLNFYV
ncbi:MAG TPA: type II toxin-antitoxin system VapC family toxin [Terracidiphilus sp.]|nr:type II toxin-antitoxin system VapC family toxin [Terracidiphilus sp.]